MVLKALLFFGLFLVVVFGLLYALIFVKWSKRKILTFDPEAELKRAENYPPSYPNGWFNVAASDTVKKGKVIEVDAFGQKLAVFRGEDGNVGVMDVYCPHLNANLADGCVKGNNLVCPFHGWEFNKNGKCEKIPFSDRIPPQASTRSWIVQENWGLILVWYHAENEAPTWSTNDYIKDFAKYKYHSRTSDVLRIHLQDFAENGADYAHFNFVHNLMIVPFADRFIHIKHSPNITFGEGDEKHLAYFTDTAELVWKNTGKVIEQAEGKAKVTFYGPGFLVFDFDTKIGKAMLIKTFTPLGTLKVRMDDYIYAPPGTFSLAIKYLIGEASAQFHDDINIWERKNFAQKPLLVSGDGPIMKVRAWYSQFYSNTKTPAQVEEPITMN